MISMEGGRENLGGVVRTIGMAPLMASITYLAMRFLIRNQNPGLTARLTRRNSQCLSFHGGFRSCHFSHREYQIRTNEAFMREIVHIELHDARINQISLGTDRAARIVLEHICVYFRATPGVFEVWGARAVLVLEDIEEFSLRGAFLTDDYVSESAILDEKGSRKVEIDVETLRTAKRLQLIFAGSGSEVHASMGSANFVIESLTEKLEDWHGPLVTQP
jgi:hypothetical protein